MKQFLYGVLSASIFWASLLYAQSIGTVSLFDFLKDDTDDDDASSFEMITIPSEESLEKGKRKGRRKKGRRRGPRHDFPAPNRYDTTVGQSGDDLTAPDRGVSMGAGGREDQLSSADIDRGIDQVFNGMERCLLALPPDAPAKGKVVFGMHIAPNGQVQKVNLKGPKVMISGDCGACFRRAVKSIRFRSFDGPDMIVHYPVQFD
jgi:hypothetical protein